MAQFDQLRNRHRETAQNLMSEMIAQVDWPRQQLEEYRVNKLRKLIGLSKAKSKWYRSRLRHIDADNFRIEDLERIPPMTKSELMDNFDEILTDPQLTLDRCEAHLESGEAYLDEKYIVFASGGSSGVRAVSVFGWEELARNWVAAMRLLSRWTKHTDVFQGPPVIASVGAAPGPHGTHFLSRIFGGGEENTIAVSDPIEKIITKLNVSQTDVLNVYSSIIPRLVKAFDEGHLKIQPKLVVAGAEPLLPEHQDAVLEAWGCPVFSSWGATEVGLIGSSSGFDSGLLIYDDLFIIEPVDTHGRPVKHGERAEKLFITPLFHHMLPVIRYELTDQLTVKDEPNTCGSNFTRTSFVEGRLDDYFIYDGEVEVHPHVFRSVLGRNKSILEYQVQQTELGAIIKTVTKEDMNVPYLEKKVAEALAALGVNDATIKITVVPSIERTGSASKLKRFVPLRGQS